MTASCLRRAELFKMKDQDLDQLLALLRMLRKSRETK